MLFRNSINPSLVSKDIAPSIESKDSKYNYTIPTIVHHPRTINGPRAASPFANVPSTTPLPPPSPHDRLSANTSHISTRARSASLHSGGRSASLQSSHLKSSIIESALVEGGSNHEDVLVIHTFTPQLNDELQLDVGTSIVMTKAYGTFPVFTNSNKDDGWGVGINPSTGAQGCFPLICVERRNSGRSGRSEMESPIVDLSQDRSHQHHFLEDDQESNLFSIAVPESPETIGPTASTFYGEYFDIGDEDDESEVSEGTAKSTRASEGLR
jgi:hypothetical protein